MSLSDGMYHFVWNVILNLIMKNGFSKAMDKLKQQLAESEATLEARKKPREETGPRIAGEGLVIDEWVRHIFHIFLPFLVHLIWSR